MDATRQTAGRASPPSGAPYGASLARTSARTSRSSGSSSLPSTIEIAPATPREVLPVIVLVCVGPGECHLVDRRIREAGLDDQLPETAPIPERQDPRRARLGRRHVTALRQHGGRNRGPGVVFRRAEDREGEPPFRPQDTARLGRAPWPARASACSPTGRRLGRPSRREDRGPRRRAPGTRRLQGRARRRAGARRRPSARRNRSR